MVLLEKKRKYLSLLLQIAYLEFCKKKKSVNDLPSAKWSLQTRLYSIGDQAFLLTATTHLYLVWSLFAWKQKNLFVDSLVFLLLQPTTTRLWHGSATLTSLVLCSICNIVQYDNYTNFWPPKWRKAMVVTYINDIHRCENNGFCVTHKVCTHTYSFGSTIIFGSTKSSFTVCMF